MSVNIRDYFRVVRKRWQFVLVLAVIGLLGGLALTLLTPKKWEASAVIFVSTAGSDSTLQLASGNSFAQARVQSYVQAASAPAVTDKVIADLGLTMTSEQLSNEISADAPLNKVLVNIHVTDSNAARSAQIANSVAKQFSTYVEQLEATDTGNTSPVKLTLLRPAVVPGSPVQPVPALNLPAGLVLGLVIGILLAILREVLDNSIKTPEDLSSRIHAPILGVIPFDKRVVENPVAFHAEPHGSRSEAFRRLRTNLQFIDVDRPPRTIAFTSALPQEGKTHAAINVAAALAEAGQRVCLIEADLRRPTIAGLLGLVGEVGLTTVLIGQAEVEDVLQNVGKNFAVMTSGPVPPNPTELLLTDNCRRIIEFISERVDVTIIDTAPLLPVADGAEISALVDATIYIARYNKTTYEQVRRAHEQLANVGVQPVGAIISMASQKANGSGEYYYYSSYGPATTPTRKEPQVASEGSHALESESGAAV